MFDKPCTRFYLIQSVFYQGKKKKKEEEKAYFHIFLLVFPKAQRRRKKRKGSFKIHCDLPSGNCLNNDDAALCLNVQVPVKEGQRVHRPPRQSRRAEEGVARSSWVLCYAGRLWQYLPSPKA